MNSALMDFLEHLLSFNLHFTITSGRIQRCIGTARQELSCLCALRAKIPERGAPIRKVAPLRFSIRPYAGGGCISLKRRDGLLVLKNVYVMLFYYRKSKYFAKSNIHNKNRE
jgi:hypothetical protein